MTARPAPPVRAQFRFFHHLRVRYNECDPQGIVFNGNYFAYFDVAMTEYMRGVGILFPTSLAEHGVDWFAVSAHADFHASARFDDVVDIGGRIAQLGTSSIHIELCVFRGDEALVSGRLVYVNADLKSRRPAPIPEALAGRIRAFEGMAPQSA